MATPRGTQQDQQSGREQSSTSRRQSSGSGAADATAGKASSAGSDVARPIASGAEVPTRRSSLFNGTRLITPWELMRRMHAEVERLVDTVERPGTGVSTSRQATGGATMSHDPMGTSDLLQVDWVPRIEVAQRDGAMVVRAELPGVKPDAINVEIDNGIVSLWGERRQERTQEEDGVLRTERVYGSFFRSIPLPDGAVEDEVTATFRDGVLELSIPVAEREPGRRVPVKS